MRNVLLLLAAAVVSASCGSPAQTQARPPDPVPSGVVIQLHNVRDLLATGGIEDLASKARREVEAAPGGAGPDVRVAPHKDCIVVIAPPDAQARVTAVLMKARDEAAPGAR